MDHTPKGKTRLSCRRGKPIHSFELSNINKTTTHSAPATTPTQNKQTPQFNLAYECSPAYFPSTQEVIDDLDVVWDWNSPHSTKNKLQNQKRTCTTQSPKLPMKRHPSNSQLQTFDKLRSELEALRNQLACETKSEQLDYNDLNLVITPLSDEIVRQGSQNELDFEALFDDKSVEEQLLLCSQQVESTIGLQVKGNCNLVKSLRISNNKLYSKLEGVKSEDSIQEVKYNRKPHFVKFNSEVNCNKRLNFGSTLNKTSTFQDNVCKTLHHDNKISNCTQNGSSRLNVSNDSLESILENFKDDDFNKLLTQNLERTSTLASDFKNDCDKERTNGLKTSVSNLEEIKQKRQEALAKLAVKRKQGSLSPIKLLPEKKEMTLWQNINEVSPIKCSPEEIEQKRLQALAKLEAKKKQDIIEKNRQEALKRLDMNKKKRTMDSQRSLVARTYSR